MNDWQKNNWRSKSRVQMPEYTDASSLQSVEAQLGQYPPLVFAGEARRLKAALGAASRGEAFLLQGGDCAESFEQFSADLIRDTFKVMLQMAMVLTYGAKVPVVKVGRMAGQFAKPRSAPTEVVGGMELPSYRGDIINELAFTPEARRPNPSKMLQAYTQAAATLNLLRAFSKGGFADIHQVHSWTLGFTESEKASSYRDMANRISDALDFMQAAGLTSDKNAELSTVDFYTSHEALLLEYEEALCRVDSTSGKYVAGSGHFIWIGDRTRQPDGAHVEFCKGVQNPIGLKCGPTTTVEDLKVLIAKLNPENELHLLELLREQPLFEVLQEGLEADERNLNIERNSRHLFLDGPGKKKNASKAARNESSTPIQPLNQSKQSSKASILKDQPATQAVLAANSSRTSTGQPTDRDPQ